VRESPLSRSVAVPGRSAAEALRQAIPSAPGDRRRLPIIFCKPEVTGSIPVRSIWKIRWKQRVFSFSESTGATVHRHVADQLRDALAELPDQQREATLLREVRGLSYQEVAATLSVTTSAAESLLFRARRTLQARLQESLAALSVGDWVQPLRELASRIGDSSLSAPAAKIAAVGLGTAVTGRALFGSTVMRPAHVPHPLSRASRPAAHRVSHDPPRRRR
jgi:RNA polymerase sigma factor (sigma-70 family)